MEVSPEIIGSLLGSLGLGTAIHQMIKNRGRAQSDLDARELAKVHSATEERKLLVTELHSLLGAERKELQESRDSHQECLQLVHKVAADLETLRKEHAMCPGQIAELSKRLETQDRRIYELSRTTTPPPFNAVKTGG